MYTASSVFCSSPEVFFVFLVPSFCPIGAVVAQAFADTAVGNLLDHLKSQHRSHGV